MKVLGKLADAAYVIVATAIIAGFGGAGWRWMRANTEVVDSSIPDWFAATAALVALILAAWLLEKLMPLRALTEERWVYRERPRHRLRGFDQESLLQIGLFALIGAVLGLSVGWPLVGLAVAIALRIRLGVRGSRRLPALLKAGRTRLIGMSAWFVQDSEVVADSLAANWENWRGREPTDRLTVLFLRRVRRRSYLPTIAVTILTATIALAGSLDKFGIVAYLIAWAILGAALYRCAEFSRVGIISRLPLVVLLIHGALASLAVWVIWGFSSPILGVILVIASIVWSGFNRGRPRRNFDLTVVDTGLGVNLPPGLTGYYFKGLGITAGLGIVVAFAAV